MPLPPLTKQQLELKGFFQAKRIAHYLLSHYCRWTTEGKCWRDNGAREAYYLLCDSWKIQRAG